MFSLLNLFKTNDKVISITNVAVRFAARKGTRERKLKLKKKRKQEVKVEAPVKKFYGKDTSLMYVKQRPSDQSRYPEPVDDVYFCQKFRPQDLSFKDMISFHREIHHPTVYNRPDAPLMLRVDIDLKLPGRQTKCLDPWKALIEMKAPFLLEGVTEPSVLAFCRENIDEIEAVTAAGAEKAGGLELIKAVQTGEVKPMDYDYVVCHPLVVTELTTIRGLMKKQFPSVKGKTLGVDLVEITRTLKNGRRVKLEHNIQEPDFGYFTACIGRLNMDVDDLEGNFKAYMEDTLKRKPTGKDYDDFILRCNSYTEFSFEKLRVNWRDYIST